MFKAINKEWNAYQLRRQLQTTNSYFNAKISTAHSEAEARKYNREKVKAIFAQAARYLNKNRLLPFGFDQTRSSGSTLRGCLPD